MTPIEDVQEMEPGEASELLADHFDWISERWFLWRIIVENSVAEHRTVTEIVRVTETLGMTGGFYFYEKGGQWQGGIEK